MLNIFLETAANAFACEQAKLASVAQIPYYLRSASFIRSTMICVSTFQTLLIEGKI